MRHIWHILIGLVMILGSHSPDVRHSGKDDVRCDFVAERISGINLPDNQFQTESPPDVAAFGSWLNAMLVADREVEQTELVLELPNNGSSDPCELKRSRQHYLRDSSQDVVLAEFIEQRRGFLVASQNLPNSPALNMGHVVLQI